MFDYAASPNLYGTADAPRASAGVGDGMSRSRTERVGYETAARVQTLRKDLPGHGPGGFPEPGELVRLTTFANINALTLIAHAVAAFDGLDEMYAAVYSIDRDSVTALRDLVASGRIRRAVIMGSDTITWRHPPRIREMWAAADAVPGLRFCMANNHAKTYGFRRGPHRVVCTTSANLARNSRIEDYVITNSAEGYDHLRGWIEATAAPYPEPTEEVEA